MQDFAVAMRKPRARHRSSRRLAAARSFGFDHAALHGSRTVAVAMATMPSPRPVKPSFSLVVALTATRSGGNAGDRCDARAHGVTMRRDAWRFAHDGDVEIADHATARAHALASKGEKAIRRSAAPLRIVGRKMLADIALGERAQDGIDQRMQRHISIRMAGHAAAMRDAHAAEHHMIAVDKGVHVEAVADAHVGKRRRVQEFGAGEIVIGGEFHVSCFAFET